MIELGGVRGLHPSKRAELARACNVSVPPEAQNPLRLTVSEQPDDWGATPSDAIEAFATAQSILGVTRELTLTLRRLDEIAFGMYEDVILEHMRDEAVIGLGFDFRDVGVVTRESEEATISRHLVRITPLGDEILKEPNVRSAAFRLDYSGAIHVFDDSGEVPACTTFSWPTLIRASRVVGGALWIVRSDT